MYRLESSYTCLVCLCIYLYIYWNIHIHAYWYWYLYINILTYLWATKTSFAGDYRKNTSPIKASPSMKICQNFQDFHIGPFGWDQLIGSLSHYLQGFVHPRWCRSSSTNSLYEWVFSFRICPLNNQTYGYTATGIYDGIVCVHWDDWTIVQVVSNETLYLKNPDQINAFHHHHHHHQQSSSSSPSWFYNSCSKKNPDSGWLHTLTQQKQSPIHARFITITAFCTWLHHTTHWPWSTHPSPTHLVIHRLGCFAQTGALGERKPETKREAV